MQTTLLGLAITVILALVTALVGPLLVDWNDYRSQFEAEASRLAGLPVRVSGALDLRLLPTPSLQLAGVQIGPPGPDALRARSLEIDISIPALVRGDLRASRMLVGGPELTVAMSEDGRAELSAGNFGFDLKALAVDHLNVDDARIAFVGIDGERRLTLEKLWFKGEVRSLAGSFRGEGAFVSGTELFGYRISAARQAGGEIRARFGLDPSGRALTLEGDGVVSMPGHVPNFEGTVTILRPAGTVLAGGRALAHETWKLTSRVTASATTAAFEQIEFQLGPDEKALKLNGSATLRMQKEARLDAVLSSAQIDIDRLIATAALPRRAPADALMALAESFGDTLAPAVAVHVDLSIDNATLAGGSVQNLRGDAHKVDGGWQLGAFSFRAPGLTQVQFGGQVTTSQRALTLGGAIDLSSVNPRQFLSWLAGRDAVQLPGFAKPVRLRGDISLGEVSIGIQRLQADIDGKALDGRLVYDWAARATRLDAELNAADLDIDSLIEFGRVAFGETQVQRPDEIALVLDIGRARFSDVEARRANVRLKYDDSGLAIERLSLGDLGGTSLEASGRIDTTSQMPRGSLSLTVNGRDLSGLSALVARHAPSAMQPAGRFIERLGSGQLKASLDVGNSVEPGRTDGRLTVEGVSSGLRFAMSASATGTMAALAASRVKAEVKAEADDSMSLYRLAGLTMAPKDPAGPGRLSLTLEGPMNGELRIGGNIASAPLEASVQGTGRVAPESGFAGQFELTVSESDVAALMGPPWRPLPASMSANVSISGSTVSLEKIAGTVAGSALNGRATFRLGKSRRIDGELAFERIDAASLIAQLAGAPRSAEGAWSEEVFGRGLSPDWAGRIALRASRAYFSSAFVASDVRATLTFSDSSIFFEDVSGKLQEGEATAELFLRRLPDGLGAKGRIGLKNADAAALFAAEGRPLSGRIGLQIEYEGSGHSPRTLIGSLRGNGTASLERGEIAKLDPAVFAAVVRAADQGMTLDAARVAAVATQALDSGPLAVAHADAALTIESGQVRIASMIAQVQNAELSLAGRADLASSQLDARIVLSGLLPQNAAGRPEIVVTLRGPLLAPKRSVETVALTGWLALRAVEQQSRKLEAIERSRSPRSQIPAPAPDGAIILPRPRPASDRAPAANDQTQRAAPLPPPIEVAPAPGSKRPQSPPRSQATTPPAAAGRTF